LAEGESRYIGRVALPLTVYRSLQTEMSIWLNASLPARVRNILFDYPAIDQLKSEFAQPICALTDKLGKDTVNQYLQLLETGKWAELVSELMLNYYDPLYRHTLPERRIEVELEPEEKALENIQSAIERVLQLSPGAM
jgi:tRNA 2-selenouridine synthase